MSTSYLGRNLQIASSRPREMINADWTVPTVDLSAIQRGKVKQVASGREKMRDL